MQELLELLCLDQLLQQFLFGLRRERFSVDELFADLPTDPFFLLITP